MVFTAFHDTTDTLPANSKGGWSKMGVRRLFHAACDLMFKVAEAANEPSVKKRWSEATFVLCMGTSMKYRAGGNDSSHQILWRTDNKRLLRWDQMSPQIVGEHVHQRETLPTLANRRSCFVFQTAPDKRTDAFFRWLAPNVGTSTRDFQLNHIILGRINEAIVRKFPKPGKVNVSQWRTHYKNISTPSRHNLGDLWMNERKFDGAFEEYIRKPRKMSDDNFRACRVNDRLWTFRNDGAWNLFQYALGDEERMDQHLQSGNYGAAILFAMEGFITDNFLEWLIETKQKYNTRDDGTSKQDFLASVSIEW
jgi:hypothetical protein